MNKSIRILIIAFAIFTSFNSHFCSIDYKRVHLVDYNTETGNFIFRGNLPVDNNQF